MKRFLIFFFILFSFNQSFAEEKIAFVDLNFIFNNSSAGKKMNKLIQSKTKKINDEFNQYKKEIDEKKNKLTTQKNVISPEEYQKKILELEKNVKEYNIIISKKNNEILELKKKARVEFSKQAITILEKFSVENSLSMILNKEHILIGKNSMDATSSILKIFDKNIKEIKVKWS